MHSSKAVLFQIVIAHVFGGLMAKTSMRQNDGVKNDELEMMKTLTEMSRAFGMAKWTWLSGNKRYVVEIAF